MPPKLIEIISSKPKRITNTQQAMSPNFKNYKRGHSNSNAHSSQITSICSIENNIFVTASKQGEIKIWHKFEEVFSYSEDGEVTGLCDLGNWVLMFVFLTKLKTLNL
jgi:hypothetical protein